MLPILLLIICGLSLKRIITISYTSIIRSRNKIEFFYQTFSEKSNIRIISKIKTNYEMISLRDFKQILSLLLQQQRLFPNDDGVCKDVFNFLIMYKEVLNEPICAELKTVIFDKVEYWIKKGPTHLKQFFRQTAHELGIGGYCEAITKKGRLCLRKRVGKKQCYCTTHLNLIKKTRNAISNDTALYKDVATLVAQYMI